MAPKNKKIALNAAAPVGMSHSMGSPMEAENHAASRRPSNHIDHVQPSPAWMSVPKKSSVEILHGNTTSRELPTRNRIESKLEHDARHVSSNNTSMHFDYFSESHWEEDDETYFTDMESSIAKNPDVIAIGVLAPSTESVESEDREAASYLVVRDVAEKEHILKMKRNQPAFDRRVSAPCSIATMKTKKQQEAKRLLADEEILVQQRQLSGGLLKAWASTTMIEQSKGKTNPIAKNSPPISLKKESSTSHEAAPPRSSSQETLGFKNGADWDDFGQRRNSPLKSHSLISFAAPPMPVRNSSNASLGTTDSQTDSDDLPSEGETSELHSSAHSVVTNSSGVELDEKTRENIIRRSSSLHIARRKNRLWQGDKKDRSRGSSDSCSSPALSHLQEAGNPHGEDLKTPAQDFGSMPAAASPTDTSKRHDQPYTLKSEVKMSPLLSNTASYAHHRPCDNKADERSGPWSVGQRAITKEHLKARNEAVLLATGMHMEEDETTCDHGYHEQTLRPIAAADIQQGQDLSEVTHDLEAQAGVPVVLPGAFAVRPGFVAGEDQGHEQTTGYDSGFEEQSLDGHPDMPEIETTASEEQPDEAPSFQPVVSNAPVEAELYEIDYAHALVLESEDELAKQQFTPYRILKVLLPLLCVLLATGITIAVVSTEGSGSKVCDRCIPEIQGWKQLGSPLMGPTDTDNIEFGFSISMAADGNRMAIGLPGLDGGDTTTVESTVGGVYILDFNGTDWTRSTEILGAEKDAKAGSSVSISKDGKRVAFGAPSSNGEGYVMIYQEKPTGLWEMVGEKITPPYLTTSASFGTSLAMSSDGTILAIGDRNTDLEEETSDVGALLIFFDDGGIWQQLGQTIYGHGENELFGWANALSGDGLRVAASAVGTDDLKGEVRVYDFIDDSWVQAGRTLVGENDRETFGSALSISESGDILAIGAPGYSKRGAQSGIGRISAFAYDGREQPWRALGSSIEGDTQFDRFGSALVLSSDGASVAIGSPENDVYGENAGLIKVLKFDGSAWIPVGSNLGRGGSLGGLFGFSVAASSDLKRVVGGAPKLAFDGKVSKVGQVWAYGQDGSDSI